MKTQKNRVFITYHGSASSLGIETDEILQSLSQKNPQPITDEKTFNFTKKILLYTLYSVLHVNLHVKPNVN